MFKYLITVLVLIMGAMAAMYFWVGVPKVYNEAALSAKTPHFFGDLQKSIAQIHIAAFYFVPKNKTSRAISDWKEVLEKNLEKLKDFHKLTLQDASSLRYEIYPEIVVGQEDNLAYDTDITQHGNPEALKRILAELEERGLWFGGRTATGVAQGDPIAGEYKVALIMYEGVGASGADNVALVSRVFLADPRYETVSASILAHEFYHTLGLPDEYVLETGVPLSEDLMGSGRERPIEKTYINRDTLKKLGI